MSSDLDLETGDEDSFGSYRAISRSAVISLVLGILSVTAFSVPALVILPLIGFLAGWHGYRNIRRYPTELSGKIPAVIGTALSLILLVSSVSLHAFTYATEVPEGYTRISFDVLQPSSEHPDLPVSPEALELNGKKVFIKGYVYPDGQTAEIKRFVLVPDMGTCCFGGQPKLTHMIEVTLTGEDRIKYSFQKRKLAGVLLVDTQLKPVSGVNGVYFQMQADYVN
ncbi:MAG: DUF3299 domain-containing protein [Pirellulaceae bacterium]